jgi:NADPH:quinone reductase-like Zn-dependent oxidoreductase
VSSAVVMTGYGPPEVLSWSAVALPEPGADQIRIRVHAAGVGPTDLAIRAGHLAAVFPSPPGTILGFEAAGTVDAVGSAVSGTAVGDQVAAFLPGLGGYAEHALASFWTAKPAGVSWADAAALPSSAEAAVRVLRELGVTRGERLLLLGGGGSVGLIATQLAVAQGVVVLSAVGDRDRELVTSLGATPVRYGPALLDDVHARTPGVDAVFDAAGRGGLADAVELAGGPSRVITLADPTAGDFGVRLSDADPAHATAALDQAMTRLAEGSLRLRGQRLIPLPEAAEAHRLLETGTIHDRVILTSALSE